MDGQALDPKHNSRQLTDGPERAPARSYLHGIGFDADALAKPIIGVASTWTETMPCNFGLRALASSVSGAGFARLAFSASIRSRILPPPSGAAARPRGALRE